MDLVHQWDTRELILLSFFKVLLGHHFSSIQMIELAPFINERNALSVVTDNNWTENNPDPYAFWPRLSTEIVDNNNHDSTWWLASGEFIRLKKILS